MSTLSFHLDCLQRYSQKAVKAFNNAEFLFLAIATLYKLPSDMSSQLLMAKVFNYIKLISRRLAAMIRKQIELVRILVYGIWH